MDLVWGFFGGRGGGGDPCINRPIVLWRPGHEVRGIPAIWSCKKHWFLYFSEALSWLWMTVFCSQLAWKAQSMFGGVLIQRWNKKKSRFERLSVSRELPEPPVSCHRSGLAAFTWSLPWRATFKRNDPCCGGSNGSLDNKVWEWSDERLSSSASPSGVIFEAGSVHRCRVWKIRILGVAKGQKVWGLGFLPPRKIFEFEVGKTQI